MFYEGATSCPLRKALVMPFRGEMSERIARANGDRGQCSSLHCSSIVVCNRVKHKVFRSSFPSKINQVIGQSLNKKPRAFCNAQGEYVRCTTCIYTGFPYLISRRNAARMRFSLPPKQAQKNGSKAKGNFSRCTRLSAYGARSLSKRW